MTKLWNTAVARGYLSREQLEEARLIRGMTPGRPLGDILVDEGFISRESLEKLHQDPDGRMPEDVIAAQRDSANRIDHFIRIRRLGRGGLGEVWLAFDLELSRYVAMKFPHKAHLAKFLDEARILARFDHPGIVPVHEIGPNYIVMSFVDGVPLDQAGLDVEESLEAVRQAACAVHHAHNHAILHGDLKPGNILLKRDPAAPRGIKATVVDFGIAQDVAELNRQLAAGECIGTPAYMAPEQLLTDGPAVDHRCDLYALGATLYTLVSGTPPYSGGRTSEVVHRVVTGEPPALEGSIPRAIAAIIRKEMSRDPAKRSGDGEQLAESIETILRRSQVRRVGGWKVAAVIAIAAAAGLAIGYLPSRNAPAPIERQIPADLRHLAEGRAREKLGDLGGAIRSYSLAIEVNASLAEAWFERGVANCEAGKYEAALEDLMAAERLAPENKRVRPYLYYAVSKLAEAEAKP